MICKAKISVIAERNNRRITPNALVSLSLKTQTSLFKEVGVFKECTSPPACNVQQIVLQIPPLNPSNLKKLNVPNLKKQSVEEVT